MKAKLIALAGLLLLASCVREVPTDLPEVQEGDLVTIRVSMPDAASRVSFTPEDGKLALSWEEGDCIRVASGSTSSVFTISRILSAHEAEFTGPAVSGSSFDILFPGTYSSAEEAGADTATPAQNGNGSTAHLRYKAALGSVDTYTEIAFTDSWADEHGGSLREAAAVKLQATLPAGVTTLKNAVLCIEGVNYTLPLENVDVSGDDQVLTAYLMLPWEEILLSEGSKLPVFVTDAAGDVYSTVLTIANDKTITGGKMNSITGVKLTLQEFAGGSGTEADPYLIASTRHLENMMNLYMNAEDPADDNSFKYWFKQIEDVDASSLAWTPLNGTGKFYKAVDYDGGGHTVSGLVPDGAYASFVGVLYGSVRNLVLDGATVDPTVSTKIGVLAGYLGTTGLPGSAENVIVRNSSVSGATYAGGFAGQIRSTGTVTNCRVENTTVTTSKGHIGGFAGYVDQKTAFTDCHVEDVTVNLTATSTGSFAGGFVGGARAESSYTNCTVTGDVTGFKNVGGFAGTAEKVTFTNCSYLGGTVTDNVSGQAQSGGFCGFPSASVSMRECHVRNAVLKFTTGQRVGGFIGQLANNSNKGQSGVNVSRCSVEDTRITGGLNTGGFVGVQYDLVELSFVSGGSVNAKGNNCGGFTGFIDSASLTNCYSTTSVLGGSQSPVGGMLGIAYKSIISYCYAAGSVSGEGAHVGAFIGQCAQQGDVPFITSCIGWDASLPFCASNEVGATIENCYAGTEGTVSRQAQALTWPTTVWDLSGALPKLLDTPARIPAIFIGDSITWQWARAYRSDAKTNIVIPLDPLPSWMTEIGDNVITHFHPGFFTGNGYLDKGVSGENTEQMLARFKADIVDLNPKVVVIMGGTNDLAQGFTKEKTVEDIAAMAEMADAAGMKVVLCTITPCNHTYSQLSNPNTKGAHIITLNGMLKEYADSKGFAWCDYWTALVGADGFAMDEQYWLYDDLHPNPDGYTLMEPIIKPIIDSLL